MTNAPAAPVSNQIQEIRVDSISGFAEALSSITSEGFSFFRGQSSINRSLLPSLLRLDKFDNRAYSDTCDQNFMIQFKSRAVSYLETVPNDDWEWMLTAQHFGLPTRLLDWSQSALVGLFFAVEDDRYTYENEEDVPVVWCLNPFELNAKAPFTIEDGILSFSQNSKAFIQTGLEEFYGIGKRKERIVNPIAVIGPRSNNRINAQRGAFTLFPLNCQAMEDYVDANRYLVKIIIDKDKKQLIKKQLFDMGISKVSVYPELQSISTDILYEYNS
ncbi:FRG domain-containing protein [Paenibacillus massiliensis]|uniref:FRG domain-containing protein n=1 Tax=Paenibacillus massiliensis TaxID=225917 RepID=UPI0003FFA81C|nr:FRG domain-containing protein [Paenibacillus massiliensis]